MSFKAKYGVQFNLRVPLIKLDDTDYAASADWTPAAGDVKVSKDGGNVANIGTLPTAVGGTGSLLWDFTLSATEMQAVEDVVIQINDAALENDAIRIEIDYGLRSGVAQAGAASTITLDASASAANDYYNLSIVDIIGGTGAGQSRVITDYVGSTKVATVDRAWATNPDSTSVFRIRGAGAELMRGTEDAALASVCTPARLGELDAGNLPADVDTLLARLTAARAGYLDKLNVSGTLAHSDAAADYKATGFATAGDAMTLTAGERTTLAAAIEAAIINDLDGNAVMQAIADLIADDMTTGDLSVQAIASAVRDAILDRVLAGNHDTAGTAGKLLQNADAAVSTRSSHVAPDLSKLDELHDNRLTAARAGHLDNLNGHIAQSGDSFPIVNSGAHGNAALKTLIDALENLSSAEAQTAAANALEAIHLDHLLAVATTTFPGLSTSILGEMLERNTTWRFIVEALSQAPSGGGGGGTDWSNTEREQIRHRLAIDGTRTAPTNTDEASLVTQVWTRNGRALSSYDGPVVVVSPIVGGIITIRKNAEYLAARGTAIEQSSTNWVDLTGAAVTAKARHRETGVITAELTGTVVNAGQPTQTIRFDVTDTWTNALDLTGGDRQYDFEAIASWSGDDKTVLWRPKLNVLNEIA